MIVAYGLLIVFSLLAGILLISIFHKNQDDYQTGIGSRFSAILILIFLALCSAQYIWG